MILRSFKTNVFPEVKDKNPSELSPIEYENAMEGASRDHFNAFDPNHRPYISPLLHRLDELREELADARSRLDLMENQAPYGLIEGKWLYESAHISPRLSSDVVDILQTFADPQILLGYDNAFRTFVRTGAEAALNVLGVPYRSPEERMGKPGGNA